MKRYIVLFLLIVLSLFCATVNAQDLKSQLDITTAITPHNNKTDVESAAIDSINYKSTLLYVYTGPATYTADNKLEIKLTQCDTQNGTYTPVLERDVWCDETVTASGTVLTLNKQLTATSTYKILYIGRRNYIKVKCDYSGSISESPLVYVDLIQGGKIIQK